MKIAVIPARGGSKRIPDKNIRDFRGKPIIAYSIEVAQQSGLFDSVVVSTDSERIAEVVESYGAQVPFMRPEELADEFTGTREVISHATKWMLDNDWPLEAVCCLYATAPFVQAADLERGLVELDTGGWSFVFSATEFASPIFRAFRRLADGGVEMFFPGSYHERSQDLPVALHDAGQFYWGRPEAWMRIERIYGRYAFPLIIPRWRVQDIDTLGDWKRAELMHRALLSEGD